LYLFALTFPFANLLKIALLIPFPFAKRSIENTSKNSQNTSPKHPIEKSAKIPQN